MACTPFGVEKDTRFMQEALKEAQKAASKDEVPIGAVVVSPEGKIVGRAHNLTEKQHAQAAHAEIQAISRAGKKIQDWRLDGHWLYVTLEPCTMCMGLIRLSRLSGVMYGAHSPLFGYRLDSGEGSRVYKKDALRVLDGLLAQEAARLLQQFFKKQRNKSE